MGDKIQTEELHKEIDLIQACITRMADNSFRLKELYISLIAIVLTVTMSQECDLQIVCMILLGVTLILWVLDAFFLKMETLYRWKYEWVIKKRVTGERRYLYDLKPLNKKMWLDADEKKECLLNFIFSKTLIPLYGTVVMTAVILLFTMILTR